jgi:putative transposase
MTDTIGYKVLLEVDAEPERILDGQSKTCNWLYNHLLERANTHKQKFIASGGKDKELSCLIYSKHGLRNLIPGLKQQYPFLKTVYSSPLKNAALRLSGSIRERQKSRRGERKNGHEVNWPKFRSWKRKWFSLLYDEPWKGYEVDGRKLKLSLGVDADENRLSVTVRMTEPLPFAHGQVKGLRIVKEVGRFYAVFTVKVGLPASKAPRRVIALDPNHKNLAYGVGTDGRAIEIENMPNLKALDRRIDELKGKRDRCQRKSKLIQFAREDGSIHRHWEPSRRWRWYNQALDRLYQLRREQTKTYLFTVANRLCREYDLIAVGDYTPHGGGITTGMRRAMNNQSLIGRFKKTMEWVAQRSGKQYMVYDERGTTRTCCECESVVEGGISPEIREWVCPDCNSAHIRDENSAQLGLRRVMKTVVPCSGHWLVEIKSRCTWRVKPTGIVTVPGGGTVCGQPQTPSRGIKPGDVVATPDPIPMSSFE